MPSTIINIWLGSVLESLVLAGCRRCEYFYVQPPREEKRSFVSAGKAWWLLHPFFQEKCWKGESLGSCELAGGCMNHVPVVQSTSSCPDYSGNAYFLWHKYVQTAQVQLCALYMGHARELDTETGNSSVGVCRSLAGLMSCESNTTCQTQVDDPSALLPC